MAVTKASASITVALERDISATWRFYRITSSISPPSQPTEAQGKAYVNNQTVPSGWSTSEPAYDGTSTNSLYTCDLTSFTDGGVSWSVVSKSSSYEAAKQAYNEAQNAKKTATNYIAELSNGIFVHPDGTPDDPHSSEACGVLITDKMEIRKDGATTAIYGDVTRIGNISNETVVYLLENYIEIGEDYFFISNNDNTIGDFRAGANGVYEKRYSSGQCASLKPSGSSKDYSNYEVGRFSIADITFSDGKTLELSLSINGTDLDLSFSDKTNRTIGDVKIVFEQDTCIIKYNWQTSSLSYQYSYSYYVYYQKPRLDWHGEIKAFSNLIEHNGTRDISLQISEETIQKYVDLGMSIT